MDASRKACPGCRHGRGLSGDGRGAGDVVSTPQAVAAEDGRSPQAPAASVTRRVRTPPGSRPVALAAVRRQGAGDRLRDAVGRRDVPLLDSHDVPHPARCPRGPRTPQSASAPEVQEARTAGHGAEPGLVVGHYQAAGAGQMDLLLPVRDPRHLQPLRGRLDARLARERRPGQAADSRHDREGERRRGSN